MDILQATLAAGIRVQKYVPSYTEQPNDVAHVVKCTSLVACCLSSARTGLTHAVTPSVQTSATSSAGTTYVPPTPLGSHALTLTAAGTQKRLSPKARPFYCHETSVIVSRPLQSHRCQIRR